MEKFRIAQLDGVVELVLDKNFITDTAEF